MIIESELIESDKYYSPDITEFHVGFECERYNDVTDIWEEYIMTHCTWSTNGIWKVLHNETNAFRVKYLDANDIESFGFKDPRYFYDADYFGYKMDGTDKYYYRLYLKPTTNGIIIVKRDIEPDWQDYEEVLFNGDIKNKSELKVLLKQLGITETI